MKEKMKQATILVQDTSTTPCLTLHYAHGDNVLDLKSLYADVSSLLTHPGRAHPSHDAQHAAFLELFWTCAASLLDYLADAYAADSALMQSVWMHVLDAWQTASPAAMYRSAADEAACRAFDADLEHTLALVRRLVSSHAAAPRIVHDPTGAAATGLAGATAYETGPFVSGLTDWQQFLCDGAPGFAPMDGLARVLSAGERGERSARFVPQPGIALVQTHTSRARSLAARVAEHEGRDARESLAAFDARALHFPRSTTTTHSIIHASCLQGRSIAYRLVQGAPPVMRHEGFADPSMLVEQPDAMLLDEAVGACRGREAYVPMTGRVGASGEGFDVWAVEGGGLEDRVGFGLGMGELFDEWWVGGWEDVESVD